jgi:hypothetical protein
LIALHHARNICHQYSQSEPGSEDEHSETSPQAESPPRSSKRPRGRPRKIANLADPRMHSNLERKGTPDPGKLFRTKKTHRGRPLKVYECLEGELQQDYLIRIARLQKKPMPSFASTPEVSPAPASRPKNKIPPPSNRATEGEKVISRQKKLGLRDWSEVIGTAALVGFSPDVIARAAQRCANLFEEGMTIRTMAELPFSEILAGSTAVYQPQAIHDFNDKSSETSSDTDISYPTSLASANPSKKGPDILQRKAPQQQKSFCPIDSCSRKTTGFRDNPSLKRHLLQVHKISDHRVEEYVLSSDDDIDGAVHVDGFLKSLKPPRGGYDRKDKRKRDLSKSHDEASGSDVLSSVSKT